MSGWISWLKGGNKDDAAAAQAESAPTASSGTGSAETAEQIREKRLRKLQATSAAAAAAAPAEEQAKTATPHAAAAIAASPHAAPRAATTAHAATATSAVATASPAVRPAVPVAVASPAHSAVPSSKLHVTPPSSPLGASVPSKKHLAVSPPHMALTPASPAKPSKPSIHTLSASVYSTLRAALPQQLMLGYSAGPGVTPAALGRAWDNAVLPDMLGVTVIDPAAGGARGSAGGKVYLAGLSNELANASPQPIEPAVDSSAAAAASSSDASASAASFSDAAPVEPYREPLQLIHRAHLDSILMERLTQQHEHAPGSSSFGWLIQAFRKGLEVEAKVTAGLAAATSAGTHSTSVYPSSPAEWQTCAESMRTAMLCMVRYIGLILSDLEIFQNGTARNAARAEFMKLLCSDSAVARTLPPGLLDSLVLTYESEPDTFALIFKPLAEELAVPPKFLPSASRMGETQPGLEEASRQLQGLVQFFRFPALARFVVQDPYWLPKGVPNSRMLMAKSTLGALLSVGASSADPAFQGVLQQKGQQELEADIVRMRTGFASYQSLCSQLFKNGVRDAFVRESLLQWLALFINGNTVRRRQQWHPLECSTDALFWNVIHVCLQLSAPIIRKAGKADLEKVNMHFLLQAQGVPNQRTEYDSITRIQATLADVKAMRAALPKPLLLTPGVAPYSPFNFVTECFFLTHAVLHEGLGSIVRQYGDLMQEISRKSRSLQSMDPSALMHGQVQSELNELFAMNLAIRVHLQDPQLTNDVIAFFEWTAHWIRFQQEQAAAETAAAAAAATAASSSSAAAPASPSSAASAAAATAAAATPAASSAAGRLLPLSSLIPEPIIETLAEYITHLGHFQSTQLSSLPQSSYGMILELVLALAAGPFALKNPHLRSNLAQFLLFLLPADGVATPNHIFAASSVMVERLVPTLLDLYVSVEDGRGMYYVKFSARNNITSLLEFLWQLPAHKSRLLTIASDFGSQSLFTRFTNVLCNDMIYLLDSGLKELTEIRATQVAMEDQHAWAAQTQQVQQERQRAYAQSEQGATSCLQLANATVHMLHYLSAEVVAPFVTPEFVQRMAHMLDYYICQLVDSKIKELRVRDPEKYSFRPRELLQEIISTWINLATDPKFLECVATDERSYRPAVFAKAARILRKRAILAEPSIRRFEELTRTLAALSESMQDLEAILGEIPDEFADQLMGVLMTDPVQLPQSRQLVDRATINRQLLNKKVDPFSNTPLTADQLIEQPELKARIEAWIEERKHAWRETKAAEAKAAEAAADAEEETNHASAAAASSSSTAPATPAAVASASASVAAPPAAPRKSYLDDD